ncbi:MAG: hypothetical protein ACRC42_03115 [Mycoplasma sp.]
MQSKLSEYEKKAQEIAEKEAQFVEMQKKLQRADLREHLSSVGFEKTDLDEIIDTMQVGDTIETSKILTSKINKLVEERTKQLTEEIKKKAHTPSSSNGSAGEINQTEIDALLGNKKDAKKVDLSKFK